jgi:sugar/nucleoside kinase (ribokinase family)
MTEKYTAVVAGHLCLDVLPDMSRSSKEKFEQMFRPGRLLDVGPVSFSTGGAVSNTGLALNKLGIKTALMGKVGDDIFGQAIQQIVMSYGADLAGGMIVDPSVASSYTVIINPPGIDRIFLHCPGANDTFSADDVRYDLLHDVKLFHFGYPPLMKRMYENDGAELVDIFRRAKKKCVTTSLDMALPDVNSPAGKANWPTIIRAVLPFVDVFLPSIEEILYMLRRDTYNDLMQRAGAVNLLAQITPELLSDISGELIEMGVKIVGLKLGERGLYVRTADAQMMELMGCAQPTNVAAWADKELWAPCFQVNVAGTSGSGDSTIAGFLSGLLRDLSPEETLTAAVAVGACNVERPDTLSGVRPWDDTLQRVQQGWPRLPLSVQSADWRFDNTQSLWIAG